MAAITAGMGRRAALACVGAAALALAPWQPAGPRPALALAIAPQGYRALEDRLDGYTFFYPEGWLPVTSSGNDCFLRNPRNIEENCFVDITSPSSSVFTSLQQLGSPEEQAKVRLDQYLNKEFMSTRLGIKREGSILFASSRTGKDGRTYYDLGIRMTSYGSRNPYVATQVRGAGGGVAGAGCAGRGRVRLDASDARSTGGSVP